MRKLVFMEGNSDCAAACLAMVFGMSTSSAVYPLLGYDPNENAGVTDFEVIAVLYAMGKMARLYGTKESVAQAWGVPASALEGRSKLPSQARLQVKLAEQQSGCAIVAVPNMEGGIGMHYVFCERGEMFDPRPNGARYIGTAKSAPALVAIFIEDRLSNAEPLQNIGCD